MHAWPPIPQTAVYLNIRTCPGQQGFSTTTKKSIRHHHPNNAPQTGLYAGSTLPCARLSNLHIHIACLHSHLQPPEAIVEERIPNKSSQILHFSSSSSSLPSCIRSHSCTAVRGVHKRTRPKASRRFIALRSTPFPSMAFTSSTRPYLAARPRAYAVSAQASPHENLSIHSFAHLHRASVF